MLSLFLLHLVLLLCSRLCTIIWMHHIFLSIVTSFSSIRPPSDTPNKVHTEKRPNHGSPNRKRCNEVAKWLQKWIHNLILITYSECVNSMRAFVCIGYIHLPIRSIRAIYQRQRAQREVIMVAAANKWKWSIWQRHTAKHCAQCSEIDTLLDSIVHLHFYILDTSLWAARVGTFNFAIGHMHSRRWALLLAPESDSFVYQHYRMHNSLSLASFTLTIAARTARLIQASCLIADTNKQKKTFDRWRSNKSAISRCTLHLNARSKQNRMASTQPDFERIILIIVSMRLMEWGANADRISHQRSVIFSRAPRHSICQNRGRKNANIVITSAFPHRFPLSIEKKIIETTK